MGDLNEINKYYPADFDPSELKRYKSKYISIKKTRESGFRKKSKRALEIRMLWPYSVQCNNCDEVMFVGTKYNARVQKLKNENYLGIPIWSIDGRCFGCQNTIRIVTDPKNFGYEMRFGGRRLHDRVFAEQKEQEEAVRRKAIFDNLDPDQKLIIKAYETNQEIDNIHTEQLLKEINKIYLTSTTNNGSASKDDLEKKNFVNKKHSNLLQKKKDELDQYSNYRAYTYLNSEHNKEINGTVSAKIDQHKDIKYQCNSNIDALNDYNDISSVD